MYLPRSTAASLLGALSQSPSPHVSRQESSTIPALHALSITTTPNGFTNPPRGWNSFGIQANPETDSSFAFNQENVLTQCDILASNSGLKANGFEYCSLDSGWSVGDHGDDNGRTIPDPSLFPGIASGEMASHLHSEGLKLGVYVVPGGFLLDVNKTISNTNVRIGDVCSGDNGLDRCNWDYEADGTQQWHDSVVAQFASWGVDFIKLDFITPGSPDNGVNLPANESLAVVAYHTAISRSGRQMRLDISWKLGRDPADYGIWSSNSDSFRTDQDINNSGQNSSMFTSWTTVQRAIDNYRQYITLHTDQDEVLSIYPDMDNMYVANEQTISGVTDEERRSILSHWMAAGSNLILGSDLTNIDDFGQSLLSNTFAFSTIADFAAKFPMRPRNPGTGAGDAKQLQAWIAGPGTSSGHTTAVVLLANYGPDLGMGGFGTSLSGTQTVSISLDELGIGNDSWTAKDVWNNQELGTLSKNSAVVKVNVGSANAKVVIAQGQGDKLSAELAEGESVVVLLTKAD
ncbi:family 27 glycoside hydrolase [Dendrothele bispora CBS 962.96]|uniref:Alpha-galactosidase n=1 Tax=Dendrothele bispora (strain CBS 962.96) TaxID=1314807 RepID=A0A4S8M4K8_DENBC|nr:family 27 glycoside hydrolase [Dendrothele bispora CBS 962.96]